jgi:hypothetical protein
MKEPWNCRFPFDRWEIVSLEDIESIPGGGVGECEWGWECEGEIVG